MPDPTPAHPHRVALTVAYDGADFHGWQRQDLALAPGQTPDDLNLAAARYRVEGDTVVLRTVQDELERGLRDLLREPVTVLGASRTDAGVHADGQCAAFTTEPGPDTGVGWPLDRGLDRLVKALNAKLPGDLLVRDARAVPIGLDPISQAIEKQYTYSIHTGPQRPLWDRRFVFWSVPDLDEHAMHTAAQHLVGEHDFTSFAQINHGRQSTVRTVFACGVTRDTDTRVRITVRGGGFLYNMVRIIAGTLVEVGRQKMQADEVPAVLAAADRTRAGPTLPPEGLCLDWVRYGEQAEP